MNSNERGIVERKIVSITTRPKSLPRLTLTLCILFVLFAASHLWVTFAKINEETQAVIAEESPHVEMLERLCPYAYAVAVATAVLSVLLALVGVILTLTPAGIGAARAAVVLYLLYAAAIALTFFANVKGIIPAGAILLLLYTLFEAFIAPDTDETAHIRKFGESLRAVRPGGLFRFLAKLLLIFAASGALVLLAEAAFYTTEFVDKLFAYGDFWTYLGFASAVGVISCGVMSAVAIVPTVVIFLLSRLINRFKGEWSYILFSFLPPIWFALVAGLTFHLIVFKVFGAEIKNLGLDGPVVVLSFLAGYLLLVTTHVNFKFILKRLPPAAQRKRPCTAGDYAVYLVNSVIAIPLFFVAVLDRLWGKRLRVPGWAFLLVGLVSAGIILTIFGSMNYPYLFEYSYGVQDLYSTVMIGVVVCLLFMIVRFAGLRSSPRLKYGLPVSAGLLLAAYLVFHCLNSSMQMRLIVNEYAPLGKTMRALLTDERRILLGNGKRPDGIFEPYGERHKTLPADTGVKDFSKEPPPIIFIISDAARPDRMSVYGYERQTTPNLDRFAGEDAVILTNARSTSTATHCGMKNFFSGCFASRCMTDIRSPAPFLTDELFEVGYERFFINFFHDDINGISMKAFTRSIPQEERWRFQYIKEYAEKEKVEEALEKIGAYEEKIKDLPPERKGYFVYLHFNATHFPWKHYQDTAKYYPGATEYGSSTEDIYDEDMNYVDITMGHFFEGLKRLGVYDKAIIIFTADHGTGLNDHGKYISFLSYEENIRIPFLIKIPGVKHRKVDVPFNGIDLAPTLVNLFRRGVPNRFDGISFLPLITGREKNADREFIINISAFNDTYTLIRNNGWKFIYHRDPARDYYLLYDLENDPKEKRNLSDEMPGKCNEFIKVLERFLWQGKGTYANPRHY